MKIVIKEKLSAHKYKTPEGYLICTDAILSRTGKQEYKRGEVFGVDCKDADSIVNIDRTEQEVFSDAALASFENKPITVEHPDEDVNIHNYKDYAVGFVRDVRRGEYEGKPVMIGNLVITDAQTIEEIENGEHTDLSCGYDCDILDEENPQQRNIRGNHVALCSQGRAGIARIVDCVEDSYYTATQKQNKEFVQNALKEMNRYINNWSFMSAQEKRNVGCSLSELKARVKELQSVKDSIKDTRLEEGKTYTAKSGAKLTIKKLECGYNDYNGNANITIYYDYVSASGNNKGSSKCSANDFFEMMTNKSMTGDSVNDSIISYRGYSIHEEYKGNLKKGEAGEYWFILDDEETYCDYLEDCKQIIDAEIKNGSGVQMWKKLYDSDIKDGIKDMLVDIKEVDAENYVVGQNGVWFAKPKGKKDMFDVAYASNDKGKTWHTCYKEKKSASSTGGSRTQAGKIIFRTSATFPGPRTSIGRNVLTWYANNGEHHQTPGYDIDHYDDNYLNDTLSNLKKITHTENIQKMQAALKKKQAVGVDSINDEGLKVYQVRNGYAIVLKRYWDRYKQNSYIERYEHSLDAARYTRWSLEVHDGLSFVIVDCTQAGKVKVVDSPQDELTKAIEKVKTANIPLGETFEYTQSHITVQVQHVGKDTYEDLSKFKHVRPKTSSHAWGRVWVDGKMTLNTSDSLVVVMNNILKHLQSLKSSIKDALVDLTSSQLREIEHAIESIGFKIDKKGRTWSGAVHYQLISKQGGYTKKEELLAYVRKLDTLDDWIEKHYHAPMTYNVGLQSDGYISAGIDIREAYVKDSISTCSKLSKVIKIIKKVKK